MLVILTQSLAVYIISIVTFLHLWHTLFRGKKTKSFAAVVYGNEDNLICSKCDRTFTMKAYLLNQLQLHTGHFKYFCEACKKGYNGKNAYNVHMDKHPGVEYQCDFCNKTFTSTQRRDYHISIHAGNCRFSCNVCNKGFNENISMKKMLHLICRPYLWRWYSIPKGFIFVECWLLIYVDLRYPSGLPIIVNI